MALHDSLKDGSRGSSHGKRRAWLREAMVVSEVVFACVLLVGSGLLMRSFLRVLDVTLGYRPASTVALRIDPSSRYAALKAQRNAYFDEALRRVRATAGSRSGEPDRRAASRRRQELGRGRQGSDDQDG